MLFSLEPKDKKEDLYDFEEALSRLIHSIRDKSTRMTVITGLRRMGKTSLLKVGLRESDVPYLYVDARMYEYLTVENFYRLLSSSLEDFIHRSEGVVGRLASFLTRVEGISVEGLHVKLRPKATSFSEVLDKIDEWATNKGVKVVIALDEAQELRRFRGIDKTLAYAYDNLHSTGLVLTGSEVGVFRRFLGVDNPDAPLFGRPHFEVKLKRLTREEAVDFLRKGFDEVGFSVAEKEVVEAVDMLNGVVGWLTYFGWYTWKLESPEAGLEKALNEGTSLVKREVERFLEGRGVSRDRYLTILEALSLEPMRWSRLKNYVEFKIERKLANNQFTKYLHELNKYGFIEKVEDKYRLGDPLLKSTIATWHF